MININSRIIYSILFFSLLLTLIYISKPSVIFEKNGEFKPFGFGSDKTLFAFGVFTVVLAIVAFYLFCIIDIVFKK
jgi:hypothetical protein